MQPPRGRLASEPIGYAESIGSTSTTVKYWATRHPRRGGFRRLPVSSPHPTTALTTSGTYSGTFTISMADQQDLSSAAATNTLTVTAHVIVVPEPSSLALAACGLAVGGYALRRRNMKK